METTDSLLLHILENHSEYVRKRDGKVIKHVLTIAHIYDDSPENCDMNNLKALCCFCHNGMDAQMRARHRKENKAKEDKSLNIFNDED